MFKQSAFVKFLEDCRTRLECCERAVDSLFPVRVRKVASERDPPAAPAQGREAAHFQKKLAIFLAEFRGLVPVVNFQSRNYGVLGQGSWIKQPRIRNYVL